jgi:hypothetical protein
MEQNYTSKQSSKKSKESLSKFNNSNYHKKTKTETSLLEENTKVNNKKNLKSLRIIQKSKISLIPENNNHKNTKKISSNRPLTSSSHSNIDIFKSKNTYNKNNYKNSFYQQHFIIQSKNSQNRGIERNRNTLPNDDKDGVIKKSNSNTSLSQIQKLKKNKSIEYHKTNILNNKNNPVKNNIKKDFLDLNKIIKTDKKIILNKLNSSKSSNNFTREFNKDQIVLGKRNKNNYLKSYYSKYNHYLNDNSEIKNTSLGTTTNALSFSETSKNLHKFNSFNNSISFSMLEKKKSKKASIFGKCYIDIELSLNNNDKSKSKNNFINKRLLKKSLNLDNSMNKESKIKNNLYSSQIEKNKKNSKNYIDLRNNYNLNKISKKIVFTSRDKIPNILGPKTKKIEIIKSKNKTAKNRLIPYNASNIIPLKYWQNPYSINNTNNNSIKKKSNYNLVGSKLKKNIDYKKDIFYNNDSKMWKDYINFQKIKSISHTPKNKIAQYDMNIKNRERFLMNYINLNSNYFTENRLNKTNRTEIYDVNNLSGNNNNNKKINKKNIFSQENFTSQTNNYMDEFNSLDNIDLKISLMNTNKKNKNDILKKYLSNEKANLSDYNNTQESVSNNETKSKKKIYIDSNLKDLKDINLIDAVSNLENNCFNLNINNLGNKASNNNKKCNGMKIIISNTDSGKKKLSISPNNKINIVQYNPNNKKFNNMNINIDEYNSKSSLNNKCILNKDGNKIINFTEYNKELSKNNKKLENIRNNNTKESYTLLKSISFCKKINNPVKLNPNKRDPKINKEFYIKSDIKRIYIPNNNRIKKINNNRINNSVSGYNQKYKNNIININNNTSNVNVLNVKNSSINICFEKKEKCENISPEKNLNYSTTVNSIHRNKRINLKNAENKIEKNKNMKNINKVNPVLNNDNVLTYIKISANTTRYNYSNSNRNDKNLYSNNKIGSYNIKNNTQPLSMNNSEINIYKNKNKNIDSQQKSKLDINNIKKNIEEDININKVSLNSARNTHNENKDKIIKIPIKKNNKTKKINLPNYPEKNSINILNKKYSYAVYIKPTCISSKSKNKNYKSEVKEKKDYIINNNLSTFRNPYKSSKSLNPEEEDLLNTPTHKNNFNTTSLLSTNNLKICKSASNFFSNSLEYNSKKSRKHLDFYHLSNSIKKIRKIREPFTKNFCFISKFYKYHLKPPKIDKCCFYKNFLNNNKQLDKVDKEKTIKNIKERISNNNKFFNLSLEKSNKDEIINNENTNKITLSNNNINNEEEKINESSQNGLIMTFGEVNYTKKNSERINNLKNSDTKNNNILNAFNNIINDESDLDIYKKLNIMHQEPENKIEDNISENEDIKFYFSDEEGSEITGNQKYPLYNSNKINNNDLCIFYEKTNGKEIDDLDKKVCKTFKKNNKNILKNAEKGLKILKNIAVRRGYKSDDELSSNNNINSEIDKTKHKIFLGTNKLNEIFFKKESQSIYDKKNNSYNIKNRNKNKYSRSVNKDIVKGITKIESFFEKKYFNDKAKINTYEGKNNRDEDFTEDNNSYNVDNIIEYDEVIKPKIRTYVQTNKNNIYFSEIKGGLGESTNDYDFAKNINSIENQYIENFDKKLYVNNSPIINKENKYTFDEMNEINNKINLSLKENLLNEFKEEFIQNKINEINDIKIQDNQKLNNNNSYFNDYLIKEPEKKLPLYEKEIKEKPKLMQNISNSNNTEINKKEKYIDKNEIKSNIIEEDLRNYISFYSEEEGGNKQINADKSYNWKAIDELINEKDYGLSYIIYQFIQICSKIIHDENTLILANDYIKNIIDYYSNNLQKDNLELIHNEMIKTFLNIDEILKNNYLMSKILGNLLFILIENRLYHIKDFNNYLKVEKQTHINLAIITKYCIISAGKFAKKYFNDFKQTKLFLNNNIFKQYVSDALKDLFYFIK